VDEESAEQAQVKCAGEIAPQATRVADSLPVRLVFWSPRLSAKALPVGGKLFLVNIDFDRANLQLAGGDAA